MSCGDELDSFKRKKEKFSIVFQLDILKMQVYALFISCSKYGEKFSASFELFLYFLPSPLAVAYFCSNY